MVEDNTQAVQEFFNLDAEHQAIILLDYKNQMAQLVHQNKEMAGIIEAINEGHQNLNTQIEAVH